MKIAILGGTGNEGFGLGYRWAAAGHEIIIGSRKQEKGAAAAQRMQEELAGAGVADDNHAVSGADNLSAAQAGEVIVLSVPYGAQAATLEAIASALDEQLIISVVVPIGEKAARVWRPPSGLSAAEEAQQQVGDGPRVVAAFQNISAHHLLDLEHEVDSDVLICGDKKADKALVEELCADAGMRGVNAGPLQNAVVAEGLTSVLIGINIRHKVKGSGIRITGI